MTAGADAVCWALMESAVRLTGVSKSFREHRAVEDLDLEIPEGSVYGFIGPNGSGKTTTLRLILRMILPDTGRVEVLGQGVGGPSGASIAYLPEERGLYRKIPVRRQLIYFGLMKGLRRREAARAADAWLERFELTDWAREKTETLSKGMTQKVQFAASVMAKPRLLILDEPFSGLDPVNMDLLRSIVFELRREGTTVIFSTHDMHMAEQMCDRVLMIYRGKKVLDGTVGSIREEYGADMVRIDLEPGNAWNPQGVPGVGAIRERSGGYEFRAEGDVSRLLRAALEAGGVTRFERIYPTLHDIFVRIARPEPEELATLGSGEAAS